MHIREYTHFFNQSSSIKKERPPRPQGERPPQEPEYIDLELTLAEALKLLASLSRYSYWRCATFHTLAKEIGVNNPHQDERETYETLHAWWRRINQEGEN
jgi:hypothetical protein